MQCINSALFWLTLVCHWLPSEAPSAVLCCHWHTQHGCITGAEFGIAAALSKRTGLVSFPAIGLQEPPRVYSETSRGCLRLCRLEQPEAPPPTCPWSHPPPLSDPALLTTAASLQRHGTAEGGQLTSVLAYPSSLRHSHYSMFCDTLGWCTEHVSI